MQSSKITFAILYPGDMGLAIAKKLISHGFRVVSVSKDRSASTKENIRNSGIEDLESLDVLVEQSDYILSLNNSKYSVSIAQEVIKKFSQSLRKPTFIDLNSNNPETVLEIEKLMDENGCKFINGAVMGASEDISGSGVVVVSGKEVDELISLLSPVFTVKNAGTATIAASAYKLLFSMVNKGINAVFFETMMAASHFGILEELNKSLMDYLPGTYNDLMKTTPTYPQHIKRRVDEMSGLAEMLEKESLSNKIAMASASIFENIFLSKILEEEKHLTVTETFQYFKDKK